MTRPFSSFQVGESAIVLQISYGDTAASVAAIQRLYRHFLPMPAVQAVRPAIDTIAIEYDPAAIDAEGLLDSIESVDVLQQGGMEKTTVLRVPVCFEPPYCKDLSSAARELKLSETQIIDLLLSRTYDVWMIGFMPGFPYMGELDPALHLARKSRPDEKIPAGSVAIAELYVGIYPFDSPGGWHVIGRTPFPLIDYSAPKPWLFDYGMRVNFYGITVAQFRREQAGRTDS